ncbi:MAG: ABC transporter permease [Paracoccaceae bacterium]
MFQRRQQNNKFIGALVMAEVTYHSIVRNVRARNNNAFVALGSSMLKVIMFVAAFYLMFSLLGLRGSAVRGDFLLYILSGIFLFLVHNQTISAVASSGGLNGPLMQHAPMNSIVAILSGALGVLYINFFTLALVLFCYHVLVFPFEIYRPLGAIGMVFLAWFTGIAIGLLFLVIRPWFPRMTGIIQMVYMRANMIASGKMFLGNSIPGYMLPMFEWNPLFHCIDQARGFMFINYNPLFSDWHYAFYVGVGFIVVGLMIEFVTRRSVSASWGARN